MRQAILSFIFALLCVVAISQNNVGIGVTDPASRLHINNNGGQYTALQLTNNSTGTTSNDGLQLILNGVGDALIFQKESRALALGTSGIDRFVILANGDIGINTQTMLGASDFTLRSYNPTGWGGMYIESPDASTGKPFYGYATNGSGKAFHWYDAATSSWRLYVLGEKFNVYADGRVGIGTTNPNSSAILDLNSINRGLLLPRMSTTQREAINAPAEGLLVYDNTLSKTYVYSSSDWETLAGGVGLWTEDNSPVGLYYNSGNAAVGDQAQFLNRFFVRSGTGNPINGRFLSDYTGGLTTYGVLSEVPGTGTGVRYGMYGRGIAPAGDASPAYGVYGIGTANSTTSKIYGVFGLVNGTGTGKMYAVYGFANGANNYAIYGLANHADALAGFFQGEVRIGSSEASVSTINIDPNGQSSAGTIDMYDDDGTKTISIRANQNTSQGGEIEMTNDAGSITIDIDADWSTQGGGYMALEDDNSARRIIMLANEAVGQGASMQLFDNAGVLTIDLDADFGGKGRVITQELEITGGSDLAEYFALSDNSPEIQPGQIVVIDSHHPGNVCISTSAYDKKVVGIVSGANGIDAGMFMGQRGSIAFGSVPVAIAGRVYVKVDESKYTIKPGDFLTSSDIPGVAMRIKNNRKARGAILGKALTTSDESGYVLILVNLQ